jgi:hypothetical protein
MQKPIDLTGQKFGRLLVLKRAENNKDGRAMWLCRCECGNERIITGKSLRNGHTRSCGCLNKDIISDVSFIDRTGERFGNLTVQQRVEDYIAPNGKHHVRWKCKCDCGNEIDVDVCNLVRGYTKSCGCYKTEMLSKIHTKHSGRYDRLYKVYANMKNRCLNKNASDYIYYGGRGIAICDEWLNDYLSFKTWAYHNGYDENADFGKCTIDRIDVNGNYEPNNCRWVDMSTQNANRRNVINKHNG